MDINSHIDWVMLLRTPDKRSGENGLQSSIETREESETAEDEENFLLCSHCHSIITHPSQRYAVNGAHQYTFANPHGLVFDIGCFRSAVGVASVGPSTDEFSWFSGFRWRVALCRSCQSHMGWLFSGGDSRFYGLILDRLVESDE